MQYKIRLLRVHLTMPPSSKPRRIVADLSHTLEFEAYSNEDNFREDNKMFAVGKSVGKLPPHLEVRSLKLATWRRSSDDN